MRVTMDPGVKQTRRSVHKCKPDSVQTLQDSERPISDKSDTFQPEAINCEMQSNDKEILFSQSQKGQEFICAKTQQAGVDSLEGFFKVRQSLLQNAAGTIDEQAMESLHRILSADLLNKEAMSIHGPKYERNPDQQKHFQSKSLRMPFSYMIRSNSTRECSSKPSPVILKDIAKCRERSRIDKGSSSFKGKQPDFFEVVKEQLQQKDLENQHLIHLLLVKQEELKDMMEICKQKEKETLLTAEKLKCEEQKNTKITAKFEHSCEDMRKELSEAKSDNRKLTKQLKALLEKYERLKIRANAVKDQLNVELEEKRSSQKTLKGLHQATQELLTKQKHLEEQRDAVAKDLGLCKETLQMMDEEHKRNLSINRRLEEELSALRTESANLRDHLCKTQEKNKDLIQLARSKEADKVKNVKESRDAIEKLNAELKKCQTEKDKVHQQVEAIKQESNLIHNKQRVDMLQLEEQQKARQQQSDGLRRQCETLMEMVNKLKMEKQILSDKLETVHQEKTATKMASMKEGERLKEAVRLLEGERKVLFAEMEDLRNDYVGISDRIAQKIGNMGAADPPLTITDMTSNQQRKTRKKCPTDDVIQNIRRKMEEENIHNS
ncbi:myosin heavy chain, embryonic smooth muscle isoform [Triplophysa rosa]|uniref:Coiled-coil domain-containing protein 110 n=1 Tax=Triplophysa rosa TaxID=992332 RepID=A0A9W7WPI7_TRIRA|nr:myosin heavy chain, embryonic smooth muscle isoform [Triplophysa rosa]XP_057198775.1 myosin heavy chain, embryonic smooth muscle isoform [Triplophysa rosa]KAI7806055.1 putative coiled-coil domain-containing protein 110 [Triplophysa rosa]